MTANMFATSSKKKPKMKKSMNRKRLFDRLVMSTSQPLLRWGEDDNEGITSSGFNPSQIAHVCFIDETAEKEKISLIIEPATPGAALSFVLNLCESSWAIKGPAKESKYEANGYFFEKNRLTGSTNVDFALILQSDLFHVYRYLILTRQD
jgi:hypothetical protein